MTASEFLNKSKPNIKGSDKPYDQFSRYEVEKIMIEFAKQWVQHALNKASDKAKINIKDHDGYTRDICEYQDIEPTNIDGDIFCYGGYVSINKDSIIDTISLNDIK